MATLSWKTKWYRIFSIFQKVFLFQNCLCSDLHYKSTHHHDVKLWQDYHSERTFDGRGVELEADIFSLFEPLFFHSYFIEMPNILFRRDWTTKMPHFFMIAYCSLKLPLNMKVNQGLMDHHFEEMLDQMVHPADPLMDMATQTLD